LAIAQIPSAPADAGWIGPTTVGVALLVGLAWAAWFEGIDLARIARNVVAFLKDLFAPSTSTAGNTRSPSPRDSQETDDDLDATVVVQRGGFGSITCVSGSLTGQRWDIPAQGLSIGRDPGSDVVVNDARISARHANIRPKQSRVVVVDTASTNGVFLNDVNNRVRGEAPLSPGDLVILSATDAAQFIYRK
jgi:hypothetical protein